jgi:hypothetical protein
MRAICLATVLLLGSLPALAQQRVGSPVEAVMLNPGTPPPLEAGGYGWAVSIAIGSGSVRWAAVGAPFHSDAGPEAGAVFVYHDSGQGWTFFAQYAAPGASAGDHFGWSVAITSGGVVYAGAPGQPSQPGLDSSGAVFEISSTGARRITPSDPMVGGRFGYSMALDGTYLLIGAPGAGAVYVFRNEPESGGWVQRNRLESSSPEDGQSFGQSVALVGTLAAIGSPCEGCTDSALAAVHLFRRFGGVNWQAERTITAPAGAADDFGRAVAIGTTGGASMVVAGSPSCELNGISSGAVFVFTGATPDWPLVAELVPRTPESGQQFGYALAAGTNRLLVGLPGAANGSGDVEAFGSSGEFSRQTFWRAPSDALPGTGRALAIHGSTALVGATLSGNMQGAAIPAHLTNDDWFAADFLTGSSTFIHRELGASLATDGDLVVVGAPGDGAADYRAGAVYVYRQAAHGPKLEAVLTAFDADRLDAFGTSVSVSGNRILVGARTQQPYGAAYLFTYEAGTWNQSHVFSSFVSFERFGWAVAISGDLVAVGAPSYWINFGGERHGAVYTYQWTGSNWTQATRVLRPLRENQDQFGTSVAISGDHMIAGAPAARQASGPRGAAVFFRRQGNQWVFNGQFYGFVQSQDGLGGAVAISDRLAIGGQADIGRVNIFRRTGDSWSQEAILVPGEPQPSFGRSVAAGNDLLAVGFPLDTVRGPRSGSAYIYYYRDGMWTDPTVVQAPDTRPFHRFGSAVAVNEIRFIAGAPGHAALGVSAGAAYSIGAPVIVEQEPPPLPHPSRLLAYPNPFRSSASLAFTLDRPGHVRLAIFDVLGRQARVLLDRDLPAGDHRQSIDANGLAAGTYLYRLEADGRVLTGRVTLAR